MCISLGLSFCTTENVKSKSLLQFAFISLGVVCLLAFRIALIRNLLPGMSSVNSKVNAKQSDKYICLLAFYQLLASKKGGSIPLVFSLC